EKSSEVNHANDGMMTAFTAKEEEAKSQVFLLRHAGGEREQITNEKDGASSPIFGLDAQTLYYSVKSSKEEQEKDDKTLKPTVVSRMKYKSDRSEEHTSELQSRFELVCRRLLAK